MNSLNYMIPITKSSADIFLCNALTQNILSTKRDTASFVFFCIGTNQVTGDSLGPLIGSQLKRLRLPHTAVYGTMDHPIHALNLERAWENVKKKHPGSCFIAIDASFGPKTHLGNICIENRPVHPGQGVGKRLPAVGDISITGIVCPNCLMRYRKLENTPFTIIRHQANIITSGIFQTLLRFFILRSP